MFQKFLQHTSWKLTWLTRILYVVCIIFCVLTVKWGKRKCWENHEKEKIRLQYLCKKSIYKWTHTVRTCVFQESTLRARLSTKLLSQECGVRCGKGPGPDSLGLTPVSSTGIRAQLSHVSNEGNNSIYLIRLLSQGLNEILYAQCFAWYWHIVSIQHVWVKKKMKQVPSSLFR